MVCPALLDILGPEGSGSRTETRARPDKPGSSQMWIFLTETVEEVEHVPSPEDLLFASVFDDSGYFD